VLPVLKVLRGATAQDLGDKTGRSAADIVKVLISHGDMTTATQSLSSTHLRPTAPPAKLTAAWRAAERPPPR